jgi:protein-S-isoprenylcysteine O-methyltransferase Ste14
VAARGHGVGLEVEGGARVDAIDGMRRIWAAAVIAGPLFFVDAPFRTLGQRFVEQRPRARLLLLSFELDLIALWAIAIFYLHRDRPLVPASLAPVAAAAGLAVTVAGLALAVTAKLRLGKWFSVTFAVKPGHELVTDGPYALTRHPMYTGWLAAAFGSAWVWNSALTLLLALLLGVPLFLHTVYEEHLFERHFGDAYFAYQGRVPRLVPFVRPGRRPPR